CGTVPVNEPAPTTSPFASTASAHTSGPRPEPSAVHAAPSQRATWFAAIPPAVANEPPASTSPLPPTANAWTSESVPLPSGDHTAPSHRATFAACVPPIAVKAPPATRWPLGSTASTCTLPATVPSDCHAPVSGSNAAMPGARIGPATVNAPATTTSAGAGPGPSASHSLVADTG